MCYGLKDLKLPHLSPWNNPTEAKGKQSQALRSKYYQSLKSLNSTQGKQSEMFSAAMWAHDD